MLGSQRDAELQDKSTSLPNALLNSHAIEWNATGCDAPLKGLARWCEAKLGPRCTHHNREYGLYDSNVPGGGFGFGAG